MKEECYEEEKAVAQFLLPGQCVVVGDSQVRYLDRAFCEREGLGWKLWGKVSCSY